MYGQSSSSQVRANLGATWNSPSAFNAEFFFDNKSWRERWSGKDEKEQTLLSTSATHSGSQDVLPNTQRTPDPQKPEIFVLPHRRRRLKGHEKTTDKHHAALSPALPSSTTTTTATEPRDRTLRQRMGTYVTLSKPRLTFLMVLTTTTAYSLFPVAVSPFASSLSLSPLTLLNLTIGTTLSSASANAFNMFLEPAHDAKMTRTRTRPLVRGLLTRRAAFIFATLAGISGVTLLYTGVNPTVAFLSASNITLYAAIYTPLKRISVINTWIGALVGSIPPLMGWAAAAGQSLPSSPTFQALLFDPISSPGGWLLAALLFAWQFPHFNALSHSIRHEYAAAGYRMLASVNPRRNALIALRYALAMFPICVGLSAVGVTSWSFVATSGVANGWLVREAWRFWRTEGAGGTARGLFWASNWHLAVVLVLAMVQKKGVWERLIYGGFEEDELEEYASENDVATDVETGA
ncbi:MAG: Protoheme IX farnesyltransferase, mitochondrial [Chrysothrix sp. TS-e1954]|nr:MAG: Protoheme IX farnesyltransferase, mitochondrial [Chrysothrix sp. TS-e1954]